VRLLANENFPRLAVEALRSRGHDIFWVRTDAPGISDREVLERAAADHRLVITFDKDFGELAFRARVPAQDGVVLFRIPTRSPEYVADVAVAALEASVDWAGKFSVVEEDRIRSVPLPAASR
jgi:predicted nuclease of predicted toxin-antitoxin system